MFTTITERVARIFIIQYEVSRKPQWIKRLKDLETCGLPMTIKKSWRDDGDTDLERTGQGVVIVEALEEDVPTIIQTINRKWSQAMSCQCSEVFECERTIEVQEVA